MSKRRDSGLDFSDIGTPIHVNVWIGELSRELRGLKTNGLFQGYHIIANTTIFGEIRALEKKCSARVSELVSWKNEFLRYPNRLKETFVCICANERDLVQAEKKGLIGVDARWVLMSLRKGRVLDPVRFLFWVKDGMSDSVEEEKRVSDIKQSCTPEKYRNFSAGAEGGVSKATSSSSLSEANTAGSRKRTREEWSDPQDKVLRALVVLRRQNKDEQAASMMNVLEMFGHNERSCSERADQLGLGQL
uniref:Uncharacterized protein n=1 Tax=Mucochytrium quahogii TaxID=96639 RepID=A0A7S2SQE0_9STRA|mmetsp:Transcript_18141/g.29435  ORF Transcript_18141/g.29435 Transcript_18141/m.29435 type:complete len:247 (+) Transcript_18141:628-1368(+)|eukprot:CAMPEP_0203762844 /NCGR_PEP_ID=MMETSP0098-20131031/15636_1 /ASSEMBLY_ACC=CAM_ASM_000208 /TAXON_ID=96639 /ORGANISM=" , Strain NY0313808BC1" /LENGTH=246 /DNA_ID=CAMNT_0050657407 /DNA_START=628 /DNA_END=1368 /DNA_ORIENTATION=+